MIYSADIYCADRGSSFPGSREKPWRNHGAERLLWLVSGTVGHDHPIDRRGTLLSVYVTSQAHSLTATIAMANIETRLRLLVAELSNENYKQSLTFYRLWFDIAQTYNQIPSDWVFDVIWNNRRLGSMMDA